MADAYGPVVNNWRVMGSANTNATENGRVRIKTECFIQAVNGYWFSGLNVHGGAAVNGQWAGVDRTGVNISQNGRTGLVAKEMWVNRTRSAQSISCLADVKVTGYAAGFSRCEIKINVPAKPSYRVSYNANGGSGAPGAQTRWWGEKLTLSNTRPTRTGHNFKGWATSSNGGVAYQPGGQYGKDSNVTLYAVWKAQTHTVSYNANGGTGAPGNQTKTYGQVLTLSNTRPTRANYIFQGWSTSANGAVQYQPGGRFGSDANTTLYAIWKLATKPPVISSLTALRVDAKGNPSESGANVAVTVKWQCDTAADSSNTLQSLKVASKGTTGNWVETTVSASGTSGTATAILTNLSADRSWQFRAVIKDKYGSATDYTKVGPQRFILDISADGRGIGIGCGAPASGLSIYGAPVLINGYDLIPRTYTSSQFLTYESGFSDYTGSAHNISRCYAHRSGYLLVLQIEVKGPLKPGYTNIGRLKDEFIPRTAINVSAVYNDAVGGTAFAIGPVEDNGYQPGCIYFGNPTNTARTWGAATFVCVVNEQEVITQ